MKNTFIILVRIVFFIVWSVFATANAQHPLQTAAVPASAVYVSPSVLDALQGKKINQAQTQARSADATVRVIVSYKTARGLSDAQRVGSTRTSVLTALPVASYKVHSSFNHIPAISMTINSAALDALRANPAVAAVNADREVFTTMLEANDLTGVATVHSMGYTGNGVVAAIIDTGVDSTSGLVHPALANDLLGQACFRTESDCIGGAGSAKDQQGHGTHVAGIITGPNGVAPDVKFYALKVFTTGSTSDTNILNALDYVVNLNTITPGAVNLVNMSLSGGNYTTEAACNADGAAYLSVFSTLNAQGVSVFVATGNDGLINQVGSPGCLTGAIGVGSVSDSAFNVSFANCTDNASPDKVDCYSNATPVQGAGELVDMLAPGCEITSLGLNSATDVTYCGTSMATPYALGAAADLIDYLKVHAMTMTPAQIEAHMEATGVPISDYRMPQTAPTFPRVNPVAMINAFVVETPTGFAVTDTTSTTASMSWTAASGAVEYRIYVSSDGGAEALAGTVTAPTVTFTDTQAACGVLTYYVRSFDGTYESLSSNTSSAVARACPTPTNTGFKAPSANQAENGGDGNGYENGPVNAYALDGISAVDTNSGNTTSTWCGNSGKDKHLYYNFGLSLPVSAAINGIEVQFAAKVDSTAGSPKICVQLSWDGGTSWTSAKSRALNATLKTYGLGSTTSTWGHVWSADDFSNGNFRVRVINVSSNKARDFSLDRIAVRVSY